MGGSPSRVERVERHRKTWGEVHQDLLYELQQNARITASSKYGIHTGEDESIEDILRKIANRVFSDAFKYEYRDDGRYCRPPNATGRRSTVARIVSIYTPIRNQIADHLRDDVFSALDLPSWMESNAIADLCHFANDSVEDDTGLDWYNCHYSQTYDARKEDQDSYKCDSCFVYVNGSLVEDGVSAGRCIVFYLGVYYPVKSPTKALRDDLIQNAYKVSVSITSDSAPWSDSSLESRLRRAGESRFQQRFGYSYDGIPPMSCRADGVASAILTRTSHLGYFQDMNIGDGISGYLDHQVFSGLNLALPSIRNRAISQVTEKYRRIIHSNCSSSWCNSYLDHCYSLSDPLLHPIHQNGIITAFHRSAKTNHGTQIWVTYIHIMTVFYETLPPEQEAVKSLFRLLCTNLLVRFKRVPPNHISDHEGLKDMLFEFAKEKFQDSFGFEYAGEHTKPPEKKDYGKMRTFGELLHTTTVPVSVSEIEKWIDFEIFTKDSSMFPSYAIGSVYDDLRDKVAELCQSDSTKQPDYWYIDSTTKVHQKPGGTVGLKHYGLYLYALGDATIEGVNVKRMFVYYLGVYHGVVQ